jgi:hypothetical protein
MQLGVNGQTFLGGSIFVDADDVIILVFGVNTVPGLDIVSQTDLEHGSTRVPYLSCIEGAAAVLDVTLGAGLTYADPFLLEIAILVTLSGITPNADDILQPACIHISILAEGAYQSLVCR